MSIRLFTSLFFLLILYICCTKSSKDENDLPYNQQVAGDYAGTFSCVSFLGFNQGYKTTESAGNIRLKAFGKDSLHLEMSSGCTPQGELFVWDSVGSVGKNYQIWVGRSQYGEIRSTKDSVRVSVPRLTGYGWLSQSFYGKKE